MNVQIPSTILGTLESFGGKVAYSYGPIITGVPLASGTYFSGYWGLVLQGSQAYLKKLQGIGDYVTPTSTGTPLALLAPGQLSTTTESRFNNIAFAFNNSGAILVAVQDNGEAGGFPVPDPSILIFWQSGNTAYQNGWAGGSPAIFNNVSVNFPTRTPSPKFPTWRTGDVSIFYQRTTGLYLRLLSDNFSGEYPVAIGFTGDYAYRTSLDLYENNFQSLYPPYRFSLFNPSRDKTTLRAVVSKSYTNFAFDNFERYEANSFSLVTSLSGFDLTGGWGNWRRPVLLSSSQGSAVSFDIWISDGYEQYAVGAKSGDLNIVSGRYFIAPFAKAHSFPIFISDSFDNYFEGTLPTNIGQSMTGAYWQNTYPVRLRVTPSGSLGG